MPHLAGPGDIPLIGENLQWPSASRARVMFIHVVNYPISWTV
jgi:hypothetical protein